MMQGARFGRSSVLVSALIGLAVAGCGGVGGEDELAEEPPQVDPGEPMFAGGPGATFDGDRLCLAAEVCTGSGLVAHAIEDMPSAPASTYFALRNATDTPQQASVAFLAYPLTCDGGSWEFRELAPGEIWEGSFDQLAYQHVGKNCRDRGAIEVALTTRENRPVLGQAFVAYPDGAGSWEAIGLTNFEQYTWPLTAAPRPPAGPYDGEQWCFTPGICAGSAPVRFTLPDAPNSPPTGNLSSFAIRNGGAQAQRASLSFFPGSRDCGVFTAEKSLEPGESWVAHLHEVVRDASGNAFCDRPGGDRGTARLTLSQEFGNVGPLPEAPPWGVGQAFIGTTTDGATYQLTALTNQTRYAVD